MRILMVNRGILRVPPKSSGGGAENQGYHLANYLAKLGHEVYFVSKTRPDAQFHNLVRVCRVPPRRAVIPPKSVFFGWVMKHLFGNILSSFVAYGTIVRESYRFDVIHCHGALAALLLRILIGRRIPVVYTMHDASPWIVHYPGIHRRAFRKLAYLMIDVPCLRKVHHIIVVGRGLSDETARWTGTRRNVTFIPVGVAAADHTTSAVRGNPRYGLFVGQLVRRKRIDILVRVASRMAGDCTKFVIVGDGPEKAKLVQLAESLEVRDRFTFAGYVNDGELARYYRGASFFVFPSTAEGFGTVIIEAMSYGLPVVASRIRCYDGMLTHDGNCLLVEPGNVEGWVECLRKLAADDGLRQRLSAEGRSFAAAHFSWETVARQTERVYKRVSMRADAALGGE